MKQTSLNVVAISVFAITISTLLGPAFNLPPAVPAIATFCLLGLATLDSFQWQGQGGTILLDLLAGSSKERRDRILHHEAGHFLVAHLLGISITGYALNAWEAFKQGQSAQGGVRFQDGELASQLQNGTLSSQVLDRYCTVWMAGIVAENIVYGNAEGGAEDRTKISAILTQLRRPSTEIKLKQNWGSLQAKNLIESHNSAYQSLVAAMEKRATVTECCDIIQQNLNSTVDS
ncbi:MAG: ATP-dependent Zn protease [Oscillatoriales cyanobacterium RU_3_3]|nr:ATP-dependent Zn protease [Oscillatoriales cyanobacterium RU_3_3]NJR25084.1 ATP-dependent Zn protease [Richelia sp. CSU_2_1]